VFIKPKENTEYNANYKQKMFTFTVNNNFKLNKIFKIYMSIYNTANKSDVNVF